MGAVVGAPPGTMVLLLLPALLSLASAQQETYTETRDITDSDGNTFSCLYTLVYDVRRAVVFRTQSSVKCDPNTNGKQTVEDIVIEAIGKTVSVTYQPRTDKTGIKKVTLTDYVPTVAPTTMAPTTTSKPPTKATSKPPTTAPSAPPSKMPSQPPTTAPNKLPSNMGQGKGRVKVKVREREKERGRRGRGRRGRERRGRERRGKG